MDDNKCRRSQGSTPLQPADIHAVSAAAPLLIGEQARIRSMHFGSSCIQVYAFDAATAVPLKTCQGDTDLCRACSKREGAIRATYDWSGPISDNQSRRADPSLARQSRICRADQFTRLRSEIGNASDQSKDSTRLRRTGGAVDTVGGRTDQPLACYAMPRTCSQDVLKAGKCSSDTRPSANYPISMLALRNIKMVRLSGLHRTCHP
jgi:hypothetical protein